MRAQLGSSLQKVSELSDEVKERSDALESVLRGADPGRKHRMEAITDAASMAILAARAAEASAVHTAEEIRRTWRRAVTRVDGLERVEERALEVARDDRRRAEAHAVDDAVATRSHQKKDAT